MDVISDPATENSSEGKRKFHARGDKKYHFKKRVPKMTA
jgi:hypothetical protein